MTKRKQKNIISVIWNTFLIYEIKEPEHEALEHSDLLTTRGGLRQQNVVSALIISDLACLRVLGSVGGRTRVAFVVVGICVLDAWHSLSGAQVMVW